MLAGAMISMAGYLSGDILGSPRMLFAFGRDGMLPAAFARVHPRYRTPALAIVVHAGVTCALTLTGSFGKLLLIANVSVLSMYFLCCAAAWQLARRDVRTGGEPFVPPGGAGHPDRRVRRGRVDPVARHARGAGSGGRRARRGDDRVPRAAAARSRQPGDRRDKVGAAAQLPSWGNPFAVTSRN